MDNKMKKISHKDTKAQNSMEQGAWGMAYMNIFRGCPAGALVAKK
jgi:hypothetical protein